MKNNTNFDECSVKRGCYNTGTPVQLIVRSTSRCNFNCSFCSASQLTGELSVDDIVQRVEQYHPVQSLIFEGGDPLCKLPQFYRDIIEEIKHRQLNVFEYGMTTNLWDFYKRPDKWADLINEYNIKLCTSFQYGNKRLIGKNVYTESMFVDVFNVVLQYTGQRVSFIAVIDQDNRHTIAKTVELAKRLGTTCKINAAFAAGSQKQGFSYPDILEEYKTLIDKKLYRYEDNTYSLVGRYLNRDSSNNCPFMRDCGKLIRCVSPQNEVSTCSIENSWINNKSPKNKNFERDTTIDPRGMFVDTKCLTCKYFEWCNQCRINVIQAKQTPNYCQRMKIIIPQLEESIQKISADYFEIIE